MEELHRIEVDVSTGERKEIAQFVYSNGETILVLDEGETPPIEYSRIR